MTMLGHDVTLASGSYTTGVTLASAGNNPFTFSGKLNAFNPADDIDPQVGLYLYANDTTTHAPISWTLGNTGSITGGQYGVADHGGGTVTNSGSINGATGTGVGIFLAGSVVNSGTITGQGGVYLKAGGSVSNTGLIGAAVRIGGAGRITNAANARIIGQQNGVDQFNAGVSVSNAGTIESTGSSPDTTYAGVLSGNAGGTVTNLSSGLIASSGTAVAMGGAAGTVINAGILNGGSYSVRFAPGFANRLVIDPGATFVGKAEGGNTIGAATASTLELASASGSGTLSGIGTKYTDFASIMVDSGAAWSFSASNTIAAGYSVVTAGTLTNLGRISGPETSGFGVSVQAGGSLINSGQISGGQRSVYMSNGGYVSNASTGTIAFGNLVGISAGGVSGNGTVVNAGTITSGATTMGSAAILLHQGGAVTNLASGTIISDFGPVDSGTIAVSVVNFGLMLAEGGPVVRLGGGGTVSNASGGTIGGVLYGVFSAAAATVTNNGSIGASGTAGVLFKAGGAVSQGSGGVITGGFYGVDVLAGGGTVNAGGRITGQAAGIVFNAGGTVSQASGGSIAGGVYGVRIENAAGTVTAGGTISGNYGVTMSGAAGVVVSQSASDIVGLSGTAVSLGTQVANRVEVYPGARFSGKVNGGNAGSTLELASAASVGSINGFGSRYLNFGTIALDNGAVWALAGPVAAATTVAFANGGSGTLTFANPGSIAGTISGFGAGETIALAGITNATGVTLRSSNILTVNETGGQSLTLPFDPAQSFSGQLFQETTNGTATDITVASTAHPVLGDETPLSVTVGGTGTITSALLLTTETGTIPGQLTYTITSQPADGAVLKNGGVVTSFTQADIDAGSITYQENGSAATSDSFAFDVTDPNGGSASGSFPIDITSTSDLLGELSVDQQLELIYIAYFNRSADGGGFGFWSGQNGTARSGGQTAAIALTNIANSFAPQPETIAIYPFLTPLVSGGTIDLTTAEAQSGLTAFIGAVYQNLFDRAADQAGQTYWVGQITSGAVGPGAAALAIGNGATGSDATELLNKIAVALDFTTRTSAAGLGTTVPLPTSFVTAARGVLSGVDGLSRNDASVTAGMNATTAYIGDPTSGQAAALGMNAQAETPLTITASNGVVDPGPGDAAIRFLAGISGDTLVLHGNSLYQVSGFDPSTDVLDLRAMLSAANVNLNGSVARLTGYLTVTDLGADAVLRFDPTGHGGGSAVAVLHGLGGTITGLNSLVSDRAIRIA